MKRMHRLLMSAVAALALGNALAQEAEDPVTADSRRVSDAYAATYDPLLFAEDAVFTDMTNPGQPFVGREAIAAMLGVFFGGAFADGRGVIDNRVIDGTMVIAEATFFGTHTGDFGGIAPTGREVEVPTVSVYHIEGGVIRWARLYYDSASLLRQLGVIE